MHELMRLKDMLVKELEEYGSKGEVTGSTLEVVDKLAHAIKNLCKVIEDYDEEEYSGRGSYARGGYSREGTYRGGDYARDGGGSYARGRGRNAKRDSMGRYSRDGEMIEQLEALMQDAPNEQIKQGIQRLIQQVDQM